MATRDFDSERREQLASRAAVSFVLAGHTYRLRRKVRPEAFIGYVEMDDAPPAQIVEMIDALMLSVLHPDDHAAYVAARAYDGDDDERVIDLDDLTDLVGWITEQVVKRPPTSGSSSLPSQPHNGTPSTLPGSPLPDEALPASPS